MCVVANLVANYMMSFFNALGIPSPAMPELLIDTPVSLALNLFIFAALPALLEEMVFRGCVLQSLRPYGDRTALWVSSLLFSLMHGNILQVPFAFIVGLVLGYAVLKTGNIWLAVAIHFANNAMANLLRLCLPENQPGRTEHPGGCGVRRARAGRDADPLYPAGAQPSSDLRASQK